MDHLKGFKVTPHEMRRGSVRFPAQYNRARLTELSIHILHFLVEAQQSILRFKGQRPFTRIAQSINAITRPYLNRHTCNLELA